MLVSNCRFSGRDVPSQQAQFSLGHETGVPGGCPQKSIFVGEAQYRTVDLSFFDTNQCESCRGDHEAGWNVPE